MPIKPPSLLLTDSGFPATTLNHTQQDLTQAWEDICGMTFPRDSEGPSPLVECIPPCSCLQTQSQRNVVDIDSILKALAS